MIYAILLRTIKEKGEQLYGVSYDKTRVNVKF